jgi:hypothetical protein
MIFDSITATHKGLTFRVDHLHDDTSEAPWDRMDSLGTVSDWESRSKAPGELIVNADGRSRRFYDFAGAVAKGRSEGMTGAHAAKIARQEFALFESWCADRWQYIGVGVALLDTDGNETGHTDALFGVESFGDYHAEIAAELMDGIAADVGDAETFDIPARTIRIREAVTA